MFKATSPGSLFLLGEYGVLYGKNAIVCAVDKHVHVTLEPRKDSLISIQSSLGQFETDKNAITIKPPFQFILATLLQFKKKLPSGCNITIVSEFSHQIGFASSAAVTVATLQVILQWLAISWPILKRIRVARDIVRKVQGSGSGADVAACTLGGIIAYRAKPLTALKLSAIYPITVIYSGNKTTTPQAISIVEKNFSSMPSIFKNICQAIDACAVAGKKAILAADWLKFGKIMTMQQGLLDALGVNTPTLTEILQLMQKDKNILGAKISGSGFGDCIVGLGDGKTAHPGLIPVSMTEQGCL